MIISHKYKYLFVEVGHTATTAISSELCKYYDGQKILRKHSLYGSFLDIANPEEKKYFVFAGKRNPLDDAVSTYFKLRRFASFDDPEERRPGAKSEIRMVEFIRKSNADFQTYFKKCRRLPYVNIVPHYWFKDYFNFIIEFENIQEDFSSVLRRLGIEQVRTLPLVNATASRRGTYNAYYTPDIRDQAHRVFGPSMKVLGYKFPEDWERTFIPLSGRVEFALVNAAGRFVVRNFGVNAKHVRLLKRLYGPA